MQTLKPVLFSIAAPLLALLLVWGVGELAIRAVISQKLIYNIEMVRYAKLLKTPDPQGLSSHVHRTNASARLMGVEVALNSMGHRSPEPGPKTKNTKRILVMGSSVTMGWGVAPEEVFTSLVQSRLNSEKPFGAATVFQVENAGIGNYDTLAQLNLLKRQYDQVRPDAVILHYFISDAEPRGKGSNSAILKHSYLAAFFYDRVRQVFMTSEKRDLERFYASLYQGDNSAWVQTRARIAEMRDLTKKNRAAFAIMIVPDVHNLRPGTAYAAIYAAVEKDLRAMGIKTLNAYPAFQAKFGDNERALWIQADDPHPNAQGHALMAELLYRWLVSDHLLAL